MFTSIHHGLPASVGKTILKSVIGSLNATVIAYTRGYLRFDAIENIAANRSGRTLADVPTIDDYCDAHAAIDEAKVNDKFTEDLGFAPVMSNAHIIERLMITRNYMAGQLTQLATQQNDVPLSIAETIRFQIDRQPDSNDTLLDAMAAAVDIDPAVLKAAKVKMINDDRAQLVEMAGRIISHLQEFNGHEFEHDEVDTQFDGLPAHVQYKLYAGVIRAYDKATQSALVSLLRGKLDAAADTKFIKANKDDMMLWLKSFYVQHDRELNEYMERGGNLPELDDRSMIDGHVQAVKPAVVAPIAPIESKAVEAAKPKMRRAPKPVTTV